VGQQHRYHTTANWASRSGRPPGLQPNRSSAARRWEGAAVPQLSLCQLSRFHPHHFQLPRRLHRRLRLPQDRQHPVDQWILSTVQLIPRTLGPPTRKHGAAESIIAVALQPHRRPSSCQLRCLSHDRPILTIAPMVSQIGKQVGQWPRRSGAAESTARVVPTKAVGV